MIKTKEIEKKKKKENWFEFSKPLKSATLIFAKRVSVRASCTFD